LEGQEYLRAAKLAGAEYARSKDLGALLQQLNAFYRAKPQRLDDFQRCYEAEVAVVDQSEGRDAAAIRLLAIKVYLLWRNVEAARSVLQTARSRDGDSLELDFLEASLHGLDANFEAARSALERINRATPSRPEVLARLVQVCEQMRDFKAAQGYLKHALRVADDWPGLGAKRARYQNLGIW
jgi:serine/threonine-protein kinase